jgi:hypothetical protein
MVVEVTQKALYQTISDLQRLMIRTFLMSQGLHGSEMVIPLIQSATLMFLANQSTVCFLSPTR